jgi:hypothetical protein
LYCGKAAEPVLAAYLPNGQLWHNDAGSRPVNRPFGHVMQARALKPVEYLPGLQTSHELPDLMYPGLHAGVGDAVGFAVGYDVGLVVGVLVGNEVGYVVGNAVGYGVGYVVGYGVGNTVG